MDMCAANAIDAKGAAALAGALGQLEQLQILNMNGSFCIVTALIRFRRGRGHAAGSSSRSDARSAHARADNPICDEGLAALAAVLGQLPRLEKLYLGSTFDIVLRIRVARDRGARV